MNHAMVKDGIKSINGKNSSIKLNTLPNAPSLPPKVLANIKAEMGAQMRSETSPRMGMLKLAYPIRSINRQKTILGVGLLFDIFF